MRQLICLLALLAPLAVHAEQDRPPGVGGMFVGDLNGDGIDDSIRSGPQLYFEKYGGPYLVTVSSKDGKPQHHLVWTGQASFAYEQGHDGRWHRLWMCTSGARGEMNVGYLNLSKPSDRGHWSMGYGGEETSVQAKLFAAVFNADNELTLTYPDAYEPPELPEGMRWDQ